MHRIMLQWEYKMEYKIKKGVPMMDENEIWSIPPYTEDDEEEDKKMLQEPMTEHEMEEYLSFFQKP